MTEPIRCGGPLSFADPAVERQVRDALDIPTGPIDAASAAELVELRLDEVTSIDGVQCLTALQVLEITSSVDLAPLVTLPALDTAIVTATTQEHLDTVFGLGFATDITLTTTPALDLAAFAPLPQITVLDLVFVPDGASPGVTKLDLSALEGRGIASLTVRHRGFPDSGLTLDEIPALGPQDYGAPFLRSLAIHDIFLTGGLTTIVKFELLEELRITGAGLTNIAELSSFHYIHTLELARNQITDLSPLLEVTPLLPLFELDLSSNRISDAAPLAGHSVVLYLNLSDNLLSDVSWLAGFAPAQLSYVRLSNNRLVDVSPLSQLTRVIEFSLRNNAITDLTSFAENASFMPELLELGNNPIDCVDQREQIATIRSRGVELEASGCAPAAREGR